MGFQVGSTIDVEKVQSINCTKTCPEDCATYTWSLKADKDDQTNVKIDLSCSKIPKVTKTVEECMEDFDVSKHPNMFLLPEECGKQSTGALSTVS